MSRASSVRAVGLATGCAVALIAPATAAAACPDATLALTADTERRVEAAMVCLINEDRAAERLALLKVHPALEAAARGHSGDMDARGYFGHTSPEGGTPEERVRAQGYQRQALGENLVKGTETAQSAMVVLRSTDQYPTNVVSPTYVDLGVGVSSRNLLFTVMFGKPLVTTTSECANADLPISSLGKARAEAAILCGINEWLAKRNINAPARADRYVRSAAARVLRDRRFDIAHVLRRLRQAGFVKSGGKGFRRVSPFKRTVGATPHNVVDWVTSRRTVALDSRHRYLGIAIDRAYVLVIAGRRT